ncbi:peptidoglycan-binding domain-containing protein [Aurantimonas sp. A2-1-M11]|uniref:peptidoglycan-binding domain-containing protein n=1 Tax=Aurantimonas sp. A2-1-M11 TaxID=3113712 RepID=UPI002F94154F
MGATLLALTRRGAANAARALARRPALSAGVTGFAILFGGVAINALHQPGPHPSPFLATRDLGEGGDTQVASNNPALMPVPLVREVQAALAEAGFYQANVDGRPGPATQAAITAFQKDQGLPTDGAATPLLLAQIRQVTAQAPNPSPRPNVIASIEERMQGIPQNVDDYSTDAPDDALQAEIGKLSDSELVRRIQAGLTSAQVAELSADGIPGERTREAIRTFEALEGLEVTGTPDPRILERLIEIGAIQ